jgi:hypothetical protein
VQLVDFEPENEVEHAIVARKQGKQALDDLIGKLAESNLCISSKTEVQQDGSGCDPFLLRHLMEVPW